MFFRPVPAANIENEGVLYVDKIVEENETNTFTIPA